MPATARRVRPSRDEVRRRLLDAALRVFAQRGFEDASMDQVAAEAGFTKGAVYSNFAGKDELFLALMDEQVDRRVQLVADLQRSGPVDPRELGRLLTRAATDDRDWQLLFLDYWARAVRDPAVREAFRAHRRQLRRHVTAAAEAVLQQHLAHTDLPVGDLATLVLALSNGLAIEGLIDPAELPADLFGEVLAALASAPTARDA